MYYSNSFLHHRIRDQLGPLDLPETTDNKASHRQARLWLTPCWKPQIPMKMLNSSPSRKATVGSIYTVLRDFSKFNTLHDVCQEKHFPEIILKFGCVCCQSKHTATQHECFHHMDTILISFCFFSKFLCWRIPTGTDRSILFSCKWKHFL